MLGVVGARIIARSQISDANHPYFLLHVLYLKGSWLPLSFSFSPLDKRDPASTEVDYGSQKFALTPISPILFPSSPTTVVSPIHILIF